MSTIIECLNLSKSYVLHTDDSSVRAHMTALHDVSFTLQEGDRLGLIGLNGSGKSTLLKILGGFIKPTKGSAILYKKVTSLASFDSLLHPDLNAIENCKLQLQVLGFKKAEIPKAVEQIIAFSGLDQFMYQPVKTYSSGMMLRLSFSIFSVTKPEVLLLDEVFSSGDINFQRKASELMLQTFKNISAIIMASHQLSEIQQYCNKCLVLEKGSVVFYGSVDEALKLYYSKNSTPQTHYYNDSIFVDEIKIKKQKFSQSEPILFQIKLTQLVADLDINPAIYISNAVGKVLIDSPIYSPTYRAIEKEKGTYTHEVELAPNLLNEGTYYVSFCFGTKNEVFAEFQNHIAFEIVTDDWEKNAGWDIPTDYPIRTRLKWTKH